MFAQSIHLKRSYQEVALHSTRNVPTEPYTIWSIWYLHVICNIKPSNKWRERAWARYGWTINRNCKCLHWIKTEWQSHELAYDVPLPFDSFVGRISTKYYLDGSERMSILCNKSAANTSIYMHEASHSSAQKQKPSATLHYIAFCQRWHKLNYLICIRLMYTCMQCINFV